MTSSAKTREPELAQLVFFRVSHKNFFACVVSAPKEPGRESFVRSMSRADPEVCLGEIERGTRQ